jgi:DNA-binding SARP family transcriptional activator/tetratricopeptide (TPR) repeat protein
VQWSLLDWQALANRIRHAGLRGGTLTEFRILGPLEVRGPGGAMVLTGRHHPRLLAMLLVEANRTVPSERLAAGLWDGAAPSTAARQLQNIAAALRRQLGPLGDRLRNVGSGYRIEVSDQELDLLRCKRHEAGAQAHRAAGRFAEAEASLDEALAEWRGPALAGVAGTSLAAAAVRLEDYRLALAEERAEIGLHLGRHEQLVRELRRLHLQHPHHERFTEQLMLALYRCGRGPEALRVYAEHSARLAEDLGTDPGAPLRELHTAVLREDPRFLFEPREPDPAAPMTLPSGTNAFAGRSASLRRLDASADAEDRPLTVLTGVGGAGKTMLALHWGHQSAHRFPGGRIYLDLRGFTPGGSALEPAEAVRRLLGSLGVETARIPSDAEDQLGLYRTLIGAERRLLILDNARDAAQVRPLLPHGARVHTLVISRRRLVGLAVSHGAEVVEIGALDPADARALLARHLGEERIAAEPEAVERILDACAGLPLALAITGAKTASRPGLALRAAADELEASRLDALAVGEESVDLRAVFSWSFHSLEPDAARLFRLLALVPGPTFDAAAAARLHGGTETAAARALDALVEAHLVEHDGPGRHRLHDLVREYAAELLRADGSDDAALHRLLDWYLGRADACRSALYPAMVGLPLPEQPIERSPLSGEEASGWLQVEWENLIAAAELGAEPDADPRTRQFAWLTADIVRGYAWLHMLGGDGVRLSTAALTAATTEDDPLGMAAAALALACALIRSNRLDEAIEHARDAAAFARRAAWPAGEASAQGNLGIACYYRGRMREGLEHAYAALHAYRAIGEHRAETTNLHWLGLFHSLLGELDTGADFLDQALKLTVDSGNAPVGVVVLTHLAEIQLFRGRLDLAAAHIAEAAALERNSVSVDRSGDLPGVIARLDLAAGRTEAALAQAERVVEALADAVDHRNRAAALVTLAAAHAGAGEHAEALAVYDRVLAMTEHDATVFHRVEALCGRAAAILHTGDAERAETAATTALRTTRAGGYRFLEGRALNVLAETALLADRPGEAESLRLLARCALAAGDPEAARRFSDEARTVYADMGAPVPADLV